jgi:addiction module HigA family antidote
MTKSRRLPPVHPGEILREDLMVPLGLSINRLARDLRVPVTRMSEIVNGRRSITAAQRSVSRAISRRRRSSG